MGTLEGKWKFSIAIGAQNRFQVPIRAFSRHAGARLDTNVF